MTTTINASTSSGLVNTADTSGILQLQTASTAALTIDASQNVGIGTASPAVKLDVNGITGWNGGTTGIVSSITGVNAAITDGGNFRVITSTTQAADVGGSIALGGYYTTTSQSVDYAVITGKKENGTGGNTAGYMSFGTRTNSSSTAERMRISSTGDVGIGTTTPARKFHVRQGGVTTLANTNGSLFTDAGNAGVLLGSDNVLGYVQGVTVAGTATVGLVLQPFGGSAMVGTTNSSPAGSSDAKGIAFFVDATTSQIIVTGNSDTAGIFNRASSDGALIRTRRQGADVGSISVTASATAYNTSSDYRLKDTVATMTGALNKVSALKPVTWKWKSTGEDGEGFIAHELAEVCPQAVHGTKDEVDADGNPVYQGVDTSFLVATLTAAIQELKTIVDAQAAEIAELKAKVA